MKLSSPLSLSPAMALRLTAAAALAIILFAANVPITNAHQQQQQQEGLLQLLLQLLTSQPATVENGTTTFQSINDSFRVQVPEGWVIRDLNNTGITLATEVLQGYGILAQLCPEEEEQQVPLANAGGNTSNISSSTSSSSNSNSCQGAQEVIHIVRYPNLDARLGFASDDGVATLSNGSENEEKQKEKSTIDNSNITPDTILAYQMQKLQEVGYLDIRIVNSADTTINIISTVLNNNVIATVPAKLVEMTYSTTSSPNETRTGYFLSTATNATPRNLGMITGYALFYEDNVITAIQNQTQNNQTYTGGEEPTVQLDETSAEPAADTSVANATTGANATEDNIVNETVTQAPEEEEEGSSTAAETTTASSSLPPPAPVIQVFGSFELIAGEEANQAIVAALSALVAQAVGEVEPADVLTVETNSNGTDGTAPATFELEADITGGTEPYTYNWDVDDSEGSDEEGDLLTFNEAGTYNIAVTVTDSTGQTASDKIEITVEEPPTEEPPTVAEPLVEETACDSSSPDLCIPLLPQN
jgi:hypothetical protein